MAITRTEEELILLRARSRMLYGSTTRNRESRFIIAIPGDLLEEHESEESSGYSSSFSSYGRRSGSSFGVRPAATSHSIGESAGGYSYTAAAYSVPKKPAVSKPSAPAPNWAVGDKVRHKTFGDGEIIATAPMANDMLLTVAFDKAGQKKIMANFAKLERL